MATRNPARKPVEGQVVEIPLFTGGWDTSQVVGNGISEPSTVRIRDRKDGIYNNPCWHRLVSKVSNNPMFERLDIQGFSSHSLTIRCNLSLPIPSFSHHFLHDSSPFMVSHRGGFMASGSPKKMPPFAGSEHRIALCALCHPNLLSLQGEHQKRMEGFPVPAKMCTKK